MSVITGLVILILVVGWIARDAFHDPRRRR
jgi:hypothetical protein